MFDLWKRQQSLPWHLFFYYSDVSFYKWQTCHLKILWNTLSVVNGLCTFTNTLFKKECLHIYKHYLHRTATTCLNPHYACFLIYIIHSLHNRDYIMYVFILRVRIESMLWYTVQLTSVILHFLTKFCISGYGCKHVNRRFFVFWTVSCEFGFEAEFDADIESDGKIARRGS